MTVTSAAAPTPAPLQALTVEQWPGWQVGLLPYRPESASDAEASALLQWVTELALLLERRTAQQAQSYLQLWTVAPKLGSEQVEQFRRGWQMERGLGVWPDREPPGDWTDEKLQDAAAAVFRGDAPHLPSYRLLRVDPRSEASAPTVLQMHATGNLLQLFTRADRQELQTSLMPVLGPKVQGTDFAREPFYVPLLDRSSASAAAGSGTLNALLGSAEVYLRDSAEDRGLLIVSRIPFTELQAR